MLVMNKMDLLKNKLKTKPLKDYYSDFDGGDDFEKACTFMENKFREKNRGEKKR